jgi:hypothetical protein
VDELTKQIAEKDKIIKSLEENLKIYGEEVKFLLIKLQTRTQN